MISLNLGKVEAIILALSNIYEMLYLCRLNDLLFFNYILPQYHIYLLTAAQKKSYSVRKICKTSLAALAAINIHTFKKQQVQVLK